MRHRKKFNQLSRTHSHRAAMLSNMAASLILHKRINTTLAKAKALRTYVEPLITKSKEDTTHSRRVVFSYLQSKEAVTELFRDISIKVADRPGGYTRILKTGNRLGDNAEMCMIELVDYNEHLLGEKEGKKAKASRRRRGGSKKETTPVAKASKTKDSKIVKEAVAEDTAIEEVVVEKAVVEDVVVEDAVVEEAVAEDTVIEDAVIEEVVVEDTVVEDTIVEEPTAESVTEEIKASEDTEEKKPE
ncbi:MAG: 50S ribosomal protein L17 [Saprospiraceae bacterium]|nr:50S ribosomal protein L17 [Saprospiraceae bacterium]